MNKAFLTIIFLILSVIVGCGVIWKMMNKVEEPDYKVIAFKGNISIRQYSPMIIADVDVEGARKEAVQEGFKVLADYIFGNNTNQEKMAMTAPVQQEFVDDAKWEISFVLPKKYSINTLPKPNNERVNIIGVAPKRYASIKFSGMNSDENIEYHKNALMKYIEENKILTIGSLKYAFYNPPWVPPFLRRNEIMIEIAEY